MYNYDGIVLHRRTSGPRWMWFTATCWRPRKEAAVTAYRDIYSQEKGYKDTIMEEHRKMGLEGAHSITKAG